MIKEERELVEQARLKEKREQYLDAEGLRTDSEKIGSGLSVERYLNMLDDNRLDSGTRAALEAADREVNCDSYARSLERAFNMQSELEAGETPAEKASFYLRQAQYTAARRWNAKLNNQYNQEDYIFPEGPGFRDNGLDKA